MPVRKSILGRLTVCVAALAAIWIGRSALSVIASSPCVDPNPAKGKGPKCRDVFCGPCEQIVCGPGVCNLSCAPIPGCVP